MLEAALWGAVAASPLLLGAAIGLHFERIPANVLAVVNAFGAGVLISAVAFDLTEEAFHAGGADAVTAGLAAGALSFYGLNRLVARRAGRQRKRSAGVRPDASANAIALGAVMDGIPESVAIGISLVGGGGVGAAFVVAVFISNVPEALSAAAGQRETHSRRRILAMWAAVVAASALAAALGFGLLKDAGGNAFGLIEAFAAGGILTMLADSMIPEAYEEYGKRHPAVGLCTALGFAVAFLLSTID